LEKVEDEVTDGVWSEIVTHKHDDILTKVQKANQRVSDIIKNEMDTIQQLKGMEAKMYAIKIKKEKKSLEGSLVGDTSQLIFDRSNNGDVSFPNFSTIGYSQSYEKPADPEIAKMADSILQELLGPDYTYQAMYEKIAVVWDKMKNHRKFRVGLLDENLELMNQKVDSMITALHGTKDLDSPTKSPQKPPKVLGSEAEGPDFKFSTFGGMGSEEPMKSRKINKKKKGREDGG
jgi:hypothetical protein